MKHSFKSIIMKSLKLILISTVLIFTFFRCKSYHKPKDFVKNSDDFTHRSNEEVYNSYLNSLSKEEQLKKIKVLYNGKIYKLKEFEQKKNIKKYQNMVVLKDSISISKYNVDNCKVLLIINK